MLEIQSFVEMALDLTGPAWRLLYPFHQHS